ncbi:bifunctional folylpolyglutamate synthase/dihydrofolate synthase [Prevotellamassilia timonensis]|uniref:bifunctional folylpolyglutamate synthase/dihydrofolate synthase n=1 Tax=Prevotellamassilia timonensis TaxID=1852370 RepID=UPI0008D9275A|nr:folylpolyglutamate synthase/dihydrofolate synthase family protein [Prevotellamassilia timonensis]
MTYEETIQYLFNSAPLFQHVGGAAYKEGLSTTHILDAHFNHPHNQYKTIHIAGTNGKGSCAHTIAAILQHTGLKVGLYTSPHLVDFRERIRINGEMMPQQYVIDFVEEERSFFEPLHPSFFELTTALAFKYFAEQHVDVAVIEVGLGGRLDCTNIINPILSVITNISFDHTQFLGSTLAQIASEKAGIIKHKVPVIIGECNAETRSVFEHKAHEVEAPILFAEDNKEVLSSEFSDLYGHKLRHYTTRSFGDIYGELTGECQIKNANTILCTLHSLSKIFSVTHEDITYAFEHVCEMTGLRGRWQILQEHPTIICDTGHNTGGWQYLAHQLAQIATSGNKLHIVFGMASDKDIERVMSTLPHEACYYWTKASVKRATSEQTIANIATKYDLHGKTYSNVAEAYEAAVNNASTNDYIYVGGSSFIVADLLRYKQTALPHEENT